MLNIPPVPMVLMLAGFIILLILLVFFGAMALRYKRYQYQSVKYSSQPIFITDSKAKIIYANDEVVKLVHISRKELRKTPIFEVLKGFNHCKLKDASCEYIEENKVCNFTFSNDHSREFQLQTKNNELIPVKVVVLRQENGDFIYYLTELSIQKNLERQLESQNKVATIGEYLSGVLHEVGNPMAAIEGIAADLCWQLETNDTELSPDYLKQQLTTIQTEANRVNQIKNEFSLINNVTSSNGQKLELIDLNTLIDQIIRLAKFDKRSKDVAINLELDYQLPALYSDAGKLTQIFMNIISNAIDAVQEQGSPKLSIITKKQANNVVVTVKDNGIGIAKERIEKIFEPFYTTKPNGTGLGLMICKRLANSININFDISSIENKETKVTLTIPTNGDNG